MNDPATRRIPRVPPGDRALTLGGRYVAEQELARGGMATVYAGRDTVLDRPVAIKILRPEPNGEPQQTFLREARAAAALRHPHIADVFDAGVESGLPYIVMEYVPGETLRELLARNGPLDPARAAGLATSLAEALDYAHRRGVVHCDIKPGNVLLPAEDVPKIVDFGIAHAAGATGAREGVIAGTAGYISPEQIEGATLDGRADVYSLAAMLYEMLTGAPPYVGGSLAAVAAQRLVRPPVPPRERNPAVPGELSDIVMRGLERDREARFASAGELAVALHDFLGGVTQHITRRPAPAGGRPAPAPARDTGRWLPDAVSSPPRRARRRAPWALLALLGALAAGAVAAAVLLAAGVLDVAGGTTVTVPDVINRPLPDAAEQVHSAGLNVAAPVELVQAQQPFGTVIDQQPAAGARVDSKSDVRIKVSVGP